jgi:hypothetical protein
MVKPLVVLALAGTLVPAAYASPHTGFSFGRVGGNIRPFTITIAADGRVRVVGGATVGRTLLTKTQLAGLTRLAVTGRFGSLAAVTSCPKTLPDVAATFIRVAGHTVRVHGTCVARYQRVWAALSAAVRLR